MKFQSLPKLNLACVFFFINMNVTYFINFLSYKNVIFIIVQHGKCILNETYRIYGPYKKINIYLPCILASRGICDNFPEANSGDRLIRTSI